MLAPLLSQHQAAARRRGIPFLLVTALKARELMLQIRPLLVERGVLSCDMPPAPLSEVESQRLEQDAMVRAVDGSGGVGGAGGKWGTGGRSSSSRRQQAREPAPAPGPLQQEGSAAAVGASQGTRQPRVSVCSWEVGKGGNCDQQRKASVLGQGGVTPQIALIQTRATAGDGAVVHLQASLQWKLVLVAKECGYSHTVMPTPPFAGPNGAWRHAQGPPHGAT